MQSRLPEYYPRVLQVLLPYACDEKRRGLSERYIRKRMERDGWTVWRSDCLTAHYAVEQYPVVIRKYRKLEELLEKLRLRDFLFYLHRVHHGLPDFICWKNRLLFIECKLHYEQVRENQLKTIALLLQRGLPVEIHRVVADRTKVRRVELCLVTGEKRVLEKQKMLKQYKSSRRKRKV